MRKEWIMRMPGVVAVAVPSGAGGMRDLVSG